MATSNGKAVESPQLKGAQKDKIGISQNYRYLAWPQSVLIPKDKVITLTFSNWSELERTHYTVLFTYLEFTLI